MFGILFTCIYRFWTSPPVSWLSWSTDVPLNVRSQCQSVLYKPKIITVVSDQREAIGKRMLQL